MTRDQLVKRFGIGATRFEWHDAVARLLILEAESREALKLGLRMTRIKPKEPPKPSGILLPSDIIGSILLGPDGRPLKGPAHG